MIMNQREPFFDRVFGPGCAEFWRHKMAWETQKAAWNAQHRAQRAAWKAQRKAEREARRARRRYYWSPFAAVWSAFWTLFWIVVVALLIFSPVFRAAVMSFVVEIPRFVVHLLYALAGRAEI